MPIDAFKKAPQCKAKTRNGDRCRNRAVTGFSVCRMHGAGNRGKRNKHKSKNPRAGAAKHGMFAKVASLKISDYLPTFANELGERIGKRYSQIDRMQQLMALQDELMMLIPHLPEPQSHLHCPRCQAVVSCFPCAENTKLERLFRAVDKCIMNGVNLQKAIKLNQEALLASRIGKIWEALSHVMARHCTPLQIASIAHDVRKVQIVGDAVRTQSKPD